VNLYGVDQREVRIKLKADRIAAHNINLFQLREQLRKANFSVSAGDIKAAEQKWLVRPQAEFKDLDDIRNLLIQPNNIKLSDLAEITYDSPERERGRHLNGTYAVGVDVQKTNGSNLVDVAENVLNEIEEIRQLGEMQGIQLYVMDNLGDDVKNSLSELVKSGLIGALLAFIVLFLFLRETTSTLIVALSVPFCLLITLGALYFAGFTLNILSLMGMMLAIGMLVDNSVVVTENIFRKRQEFSDPVEATHVAVSEVSLAITAGTMTSVIVFAPIVFGASNGLTLFLKHTAFTIIVALLASLIIAQTLIPMLAARIKSARVTEEGRLMRSIANKYAKMLRTALDKAWLSVLGLLTIFLITGLSWGNFDVDMGAEDPSKRLFLRYNIRGVHPLEATEATVNTIEEFLFANKQRFQIESVYSFFDTQRAESTIILREDSTLDPAEVQKEIEAEVPQIVIGSPSFQRNRQGENNTFNVQIYGDSTDRLVEISKELISTLKNVDGLINILPDIYSSAREIQIKIKKDKAAQLNINPTVVASSIATALRGDNLRKLRTSDGEITVKVEYSDSDAQSISSIKQLPIYTGDGKRVALEQVAEVNDAYGTTVIRREDRRTSLGISADFSEDAKVDDIRKNTNRLLSAYNFPPGYGWGFGQGFSEDDEDLQTMMFNVALAIPLIFIVMAALFESLLYPLSIITSIGFSFIGVVIFFSLTGTTFTIMAAIGMLILIGIVVNNGIVLVEHINVLREKGLQRSEAIVQAGRDRLRPILMTVITTVLGLLPLAMGGTTIASGGPSYYPMARAIIGGLTFSTIVSLLVVPVIYAWLDDLSRWGSSVKHAAKSS